MFPMIVRLTPRPIAIAILTSATLISVILCASGALAEDLKGSEMGKDNLGPLSAFMAMAATPYEGYLYRKSMKSRARSQDDLRAAGIDPEEEITLEDSHSAWLRNPGAMRAFFFDAKSTMALRNKGAVISGLTAAEHGGSAALALRGVKPSGVSTAKQVRGEPPKGMMKLGGDQTWAPLPNPRPFLAGMKFATPYQREMTARALLVAGQTARDLLDAGFSAEEGNKVRHGQDVTIRTQEEADAVKRADKAGLVGQNLLEKGRSVSGLTAAEHGRRRLAD